MRKAAILLVTLMLVSCGLTPTPEVIEKIVEKTIRETVEVTKEVTKIVERIRISEKVVTVVVTSDFSVGITPDINTRECLIYGENMIPLLEDFAATLKRIRAVGFDNTYGIIMGSTELQSISWEIASINPPEEISDCHYAFATEISKYAKVLEDALLITSTRDLRLVLDKAEQVLKNLETNGDCLTDYARQCRP